MGYVDAHFAAEEAFSQEAGFPEQEGHRQIHEASERQALQGVEEARSGDEAALREIIAMIWAWLAGHIGVRDEAQGEFCRALETPSNLWGRPVANSMTCSRRWGRTGGPRKAVRWGGYVLPVTSLSPTLWPHAFIAAGRSLHEASRENGPGNVANARLCLSNVSRTGQVQWSSAPAQPMMGRPAACRSGGGSWR